VIPHGNDNQPSGTFSDEAIRALIQIAALHRVVVARALRWLGLSEQRLSLRWVEACRVQAAAICGSLSK